MKTLHNTLMTLFATGAIVTATSAFALPANWGDSLTAWTATASSCAIDESSAGKYEVSGSQFRYLGTNVSTTSYFPLLITQPITVRCNVTPIYDYVPQAPEGFIPASNLAVNPQWNTLIVGYKDPDGIGTNASVSASLKRVIRATMVESTVATFNSNLSASVAANEDVKPFNHAFDFQNNDYYVEINLYRTDTSVATPAAYTVRLANGGVTTIPN